MRDGIYIPHPMAYLLLVTLLKFLLTAFTSRKPKGEVLLA